jgi:hypothetical protein
MIGVSDVVVAIEELNLTEVADSVELFMLDCVDSIELFRLDMLMLVPLLVVTIDENVGTIEEFRLSVSIVKVEDAYPIVVFEVEMYALIVDVDNVE